MHGSETPVLASTRDKALSQGSGATIDLLAECQQEVPSDYERLLAELWERRHRVAEEAVRSRRPNRLLRGLRNA